MTPITDYLPTCQYLVDQVWGYIVDSGGVPAPPAAPTTQAQLDAWNDLSTFNPPTFYFQQPPGAPAG